MKGIFNTFFYEPLYNGFIFLFDTLPFFDAGVIVIIFTIIVKFILFPLSKKSIKAQIEIKKIQPEIEKIKKEHKKNPQEQARLTMDLYKERKINPFTSIVVIFLQIPIIFALFFIFLKSGLPSIDETILYSFIPRPEDINMIFIGLIDISSKSWVLASLAGISSFLQIRMSVPAIKKRKNKNEYNFKDELARSMNIQMRFVFPFIVLFISYSISGAVALYWTTSNLFTLGQEAFLKKKFKNKEDNTEEKIN